MPDNYSIYRPNEKDWDELAWQIKDSGAIFFPYSDGGTCHILYISHEHQYEKLGVFPFGGNPAGLYIVGVLKKGFFYFELNKQSNIMPDYFREKIEVGQRDAKLICELLNELGKRL